MLLSTKGDYGVRAMIDLAKHEGGGPVQRAEIARRRQIPESYLDHLLAQLRRAGFVRSVRGPGGGHMLARPAEECPSPAESYARMRIGRVAAGYGPGSLELPGRLTAHLGRSSPEGEDRKSVV